MSLFIAKLIFMIVILWLRWGTMYCRGGLTEKGMLILVVIFLMMQSIPCNGFEHSEKVNDEIEATVFQDQFTSTSLSTTRWPTGGRQGTPTVVGSSGGVSNPPSSPYALNLDGDGDQVTSQTLDLTPYAKGTLSFYYEKGGTGDGPEPGEDLIVEWQLSTGWTEAFRANGSDPNSTSFTQITLNLPAQAFHTTFSFRMKIASGQAGQDDWYIDDVIIDALTGPPWINITKPNGGEKWSVGTTGEIKWNAGGGSGTLTIDLDYSTSGPSGPWKSIKTGLQNTGTYYWTIPNDPSTNCYIRGTVKDQSQSATDISDNSFEIYVSPLGVHLRDPNGGEVWEVSQSYFINWSAVGGIPPRKIDLEYSTTGSSGPWKTIVKDINDLGGYAWNVPNDPSTDAYVKVTVRDSGGNTVTDISNSSFTIKMPPPPEIWVSSPNGGENWTAGETKDITWGSKGKFNRMNISYSTTGPTGPWTLITDQAVNIGVYSWDVPNTPSTSAYVKVFARDVFGRLAEDISNSSFTISPRPFNVTVTSPKPGDDWLVGSIQVISWVIAGGNPPFTSTLEYSVSGKGGPWKPIASGLSSTTYTWTVPDDPSMNAYIRVTVRDSKSATVSGMNPAEFLISLPKPTVKVIKPNGGELLTAGTHYTIQWTASGGVGPLSSSISYSTTGWSGPYITIASDLKNQVSYDWVVPAEPTNDGFIMITVTDGRSTVNDTSDNSFTISTSSGTMEGVKILSPAGGENWNAFTEHEILWKTTGTGPYIINLKFSTKSKSGPWTSIAYDLPDTGKYRWRIPDIGQTSDTSYVLVEAKNTSSGATYTSVNDKPFTITRQGVITGIKGTVLDSSNGTPIPDAQVEIVETGDYSITDEYGAYLIPYLEPGTYTLKATRPGYRTFTTEVTLNANELKTVDIMLEPAITGTERNAFIAFLVDNWVMLLVLIVVIVVLLAIVSALAKRKATSPGNCKICRMPVPPGQKYCAMCADRHGLVICPKCKKMMPKGSSWCTACGEILPGSAPTAPSGDSVSVITVTVPAECPGCEKQVEVNTKAVRCVCGALYHKECSDAVEICRKCKRRVKLVS